MQIKNKALEYVMTKGYSLFPISNQTRKPLIAWKPYQKAAPSEEEVASWWEEHPTAGVGIVTGEVSQLTVVDIDVKGREEHMTPDDFPPTYTVKTKSGGWHLYYNYHEGIRNSADGWEGLPGVDIRNNGGFVVAPPTSGYTVTRDVPLEAFPTEIFHTEKKKSGGKYKLSERIGVSSGSRNQAMTSLVGSLLHGVAEEQWEKEIWPTVLKLNQTYVPPLPDDEIKKVFESVTSMEKTKRDEAKKMVLGSVRSPVQFDASERTEMKLRTSKNGVVVKDKLNALIALSNHPDWVGAFRYDEFKKQVLFGNQPMKDHHVLTTQTWLQGEMGMPGLARNIVSDAIEERAHVCAFDSALDWLKSLEWDGTPRVDTWLSSVYGVDDDEYHRGVGSNWFRAIVKRLVWPASKFDHVLVIQGGQGVRKTTSISALGKDWHVETIVKADDKDFIMQFDGKAIVEFSEGGTLSHSDTKTLKAIITRVSDKYRAPYGRVVEEHPRRCVFCMTTNEIQYLKDETGNRRWWVVRMPEEVDADVEWIEENRDQLFAEAYHRREEGWLDIPKDVAEEKQEESRIVDNIEEKVVDWYGNLSEEAREKGVSPWDFFEFLHIGKEEKMPVTIPWNIEIKVKSAFAGVLRLVFAQRRREGKKVRRWFMSKSTPKRHKGVGHF
jgi:predicted P-loop ATPase